MISVIIPLYNKQDSIQNTIRCVLNQTYTQFEIVIVDDGSTDNSLSRVEEINDKRINIISKKNGGVSSARNEGIRHAKYEYISFLDADDFWEPTYLEELVKLIADFPDAGIYGIGYGSMQKEIKIQNSFNMPLEFRDYVNNVWTKGYMYWTGSTTTTTTTAINKVGFFDERMTHGEDLDMWYRLILEFPSVFYNNTLAYYIQDSENRAMNRYIPFEKHIPFYIEKYKDYRENNVDFRRYFDREMLYRLYPYALEDRSNPNLKRVLSQIDFGLQKKSLKFRFLFPRLYLCYLTTKNKIGNNNKKPLL